MDILRFDQLLVLTIFMAALGAIWAFVHRHKHGLSEKLHRGKRMHLGDSLSLGGHLRATLLSVDGHDFLLVHGKSGPTVLHALDAAQPNLEGQP